MTAVIPSDFMRVKYRREPVEPNLHEEGKTEGKALSMARKVREKEIDFASENANLRFKPAIMLPAHTQNTRVEKVILSDDKEYRRQTKPTLFERVETQRVAAKQIQRNEAARVASELEKLRVRELLALEAAGNDNDNDEGDEESVAQGEAAKEDKEGRYDAETEHMDEEDAAEFKRQRLEAKERKVLRTRYVPVCLCLYISISLSLMHAHTSPSLTHLLTHSLQERARVPHARRQVGAAAPGLHPHPQPWQSHQRHHADPALAAHGAQGVRTGYIPAQVDRDGCYAHYERHRRLSKRVPRTVRVHEDTCQGRRTR